jgi:hypothetical protein
MRMTGNQAMMPDFCGNAQGALRIATASCNGGTWALGWMPAA